MLSVAIMGVTGAVGTELLRTLERRDFPVGSLRPLASERSVNAGRTIDFRGKTYPVELLTKDSFGGIDLVLSSAGGDISKEFVPSAVEAGAVVVDNTSAFRMDEGVPLVIPEVNADALATHKGIIANPNCSTIIMLMAIAPLHRAAGIKRVVVSTYQAASGAGQPAMDELIAHSKLFVEGKHAPPSEQFAHSVAFNCLPHCDVFMDNDYTREEMKMVHETHKILEDDSVRVTATAVRVPVVRCHSESINIETEKKLTADEAREVLRAAPGVIVEDDPAASLYPMATTATQRDETFVGRIREDDTIENGLNLWVVGDQILKGAALNAVQIAEILNERGLISATSS